MICTVGNQCRRKQSDVKHITINRHLNSPTGGSESRLVRRECMDSLANIQHSLKWGHVMWEGVPDMWTKYNCTIDVIGTGAFLPNEAST